MILWRGFLCGVAILSLGGLALAQETPSGENPEGKLKPSALGVRQQRVERMMEDLERKFKSLSQTLEKTEPERAERLIKTLQQSKQLLIQQRMTGISKMLDEAKLDTATGEQKKILADLRALIDLLLEENDRNKAMEELERLQKWKEEIGKILEEQRPQRNESDKIANKDKTLADLAARIKAVEALIKKQEEVIKTTETARAKGIEGLGKAADAQRKVREETEKLAGEIAKAGGQTPKESTGEGKPGEGKPGEGKPGEGKPGEGKPGEGKPGEGKPGEGKPGEGKPGEGKPGEGKPGEGKPGEGKPGEGKPGEGSKSGSKSGSQPAEPGQKPLERAAANQQSAEQKLDEGKGKAGQQDEEQALAELNKALEELKKESRRIASLPKEAFDEMASKQNETADKTGGLGEQMEKASQGEGSQGGGEGGGKGGGKKAPGKEQVKQAQKNMQQASGNLKKQDPAGATRQQDEAIKQLEKALKEIEDRLAQLREETQAEKLARLEARFTEMLARQQKTTITTLDLDKAKTANGGELKRTDRLLLAKQAEEERALAEMAQQALDILIEDGTSVVFPEIVGQLRDDLARVGEMLDAQRTEGYTQAVQKEIELTLIELIEALQKAQQQKKEGGGGGGGGGGDEPLLPNSAELKLLRAAQLRVNRRTEAFDKNRPTGGLDEILKKEVKGIAVRQEEISIMTERILER